MYIVDNLPLYGLNKDAKHGDLTAENIKDYGQEAVKVDNLVESVSTGYWKLPEDSPSYYLDGEAGKEQYKEALQGHLHVQVYYTRRSESRDYRQAIGGDATVDSLYTDGPAKG